MSEIKSTEGPLYYPEGFPIIAIRGEDNRALLALRSDGTVECDSLLNATEAGRMFVDTVSGAWGGQARRIAELDAEVARQRGVIEAWKRIDDEREKLFGTIIQTIRQLAALEYDPESRTIEKIADEILTLVTEKVAS